MAAGPAGPVVRLSGEADLSTAAELTEVLTCQVASGARHLTVDVSRPCGQLEDKRDAGTARAGDRLHLVREPPCHPQAMTGQLRNGSSEAAGSAEAIKSPSSTWQCSAPVSCQTRDRSSGSPA